MSHNVLALAVSGLKFNTEHYKHTNKIGVNSVFSQEKTKPKPLLQTCVGGSVELEEKSSF
jgi:hypothetical protein